MGEHSTAVQPAVSPTDREVKMLYFGCVECSGHYMWKPGRSGPQSDYRTATPWGENPDGILPPHENPNCTFREKYYYCLCSQIQGIAEIHHKDGWTAMSFWDRSVDSRSGCNSNFFAEGIFNFDEMLALSKRYFPTIMERFGFAIHLKPEL